MSPFTLPNIRPDGLLGVVTTSTLTPQALINTMLKLRRHKLSRDNPASGHDSGPEAGLLLEELFQNLHYFYCSIQVSAGSQSVLNEKAIKLVWT